MRLFLARGDGGLAAGRVRDLIMKGAVGDLAWTGLRRQLDERARWHADPARVLIDHLVQLRAVEGSPVGEGWIRLAPLALGALGAELSAAGVDVPVVQGDPARMSAAAVAAVHGGLPTRSSARWLIAGWPPARRGGRPVRCLSTPLVPTRPRGSRWWASSAAWESGRRRRGGTPLKRPELRPYARIELTRLASQLADSTMPLVLEPARMT